VVLDSLNSRVQVLNPDGSFVRMFGERGTALGSFMLPKAFELSMNLDFARPATNHTETAG